ncbi:MAG: hypothetical protein EA384_14860 [Spirochaetaceae bacterium]|nr:MAG: hypothetical protein EA384_14860 [Spirochaetaceae bacterium]
MQTHYYLSVFPLEALIASQLDPMHFGQYMSTGKKNGSYERIMFIEIQGGFGTAFDWAYARGRCVTHDDGSPKNSVWMSVYRALEHVELDALQSLFLTTADGRTLEIQPSAAQPASNARGYYVYQEICPITPLVVSNLDPVQFSTYMTNPANKVFVPKLVFADLKTLDLERTTDTTDSGPVYDKNLGHLKDCIMAVKHGADKPNKNVERSVQSFAYNIIDRGIYVGDGSRVIEYRMPSREQIRQNYYDWGRSAMVL